MKTFTLKQTISWFGAGAAVLVLVGGLYMFLRFEMPEENESDPQLATSVLTSNRGPTQTPIPPARSGFPTFRPPPPESPAQRDAALAAVGSDAEFEAETRHRIQLLQNEYEALEQGSMQLNEQMRQVEAEFMFTENPDPALSTRRNMLRSRLIEQDRAMNARLNQIQDLRMGL